MPNLRQEWKKVLAKVERIKFYHCQGVIRKNRKWVRCRKKASKFYPGIEAWLCEGCKP